MITLKSNAEATVEFNALGTGFVIEPGKEFKATLDEANYITKHLSFVMVTGSSKEEVVEKEDSKIPKAPKKEEEVKEKVKEEVKTPAAKTSKK